MKKRLEKEKNDTANARLAANEKVRKSWLYSTKIYVGSD